MIVAVSRRSLVSIGVAFAVMCVSRDAFASLKIKWDCYLPSGGVDCQTTQTSLASKVPFIEWVRDAKDADVVVTLASLPAEGGTRYKFDFVGKRVDGYVTEVHSTDKIPWSIDSTTANVRVMTKLQRGLDDFMDQKIAAETHDGVLTIELRDPSTLPFTGRPEQSSSNWYFAPALGIYFSDVETVGINASGSASLFFNLSGDVFRLQQSMSVNYSQQSQPVPGTNETASISFTGFNGFNVLSWSLGADRQWNLGVMLSGEKNPQANYNMRANASVGLEFDLIPRQTVNQKNFGFRCAVGGEYQRYDTINIENIEHQFVGRQFCDIFLGWHFSLIDVYASIGETTLLEDFSYRSFSASLSATWRVTDNFTITPWVSIQQVNQAINEATPVTTTFSDPREEIEASMLAAIQQGYTAPLSVQTGLSIKYLIGNGSLNSEDQRWKGVTNLR